MNNEDKITALLASSPGLDDDEISSHTSIRPRQQVNQICRQLQAKGRLKRVRGPRGKIVNYLNGSSPPNVQTQAEVKRERPEIRSVASAVKDIANRSRVSIGNAELDDVGKLDLKNTLIVIPCSGSKAPGGHTSTGPTYPAFLPPALAERLKRARAQVATKSSLDESVLLPAWRRYTGTLYQSAFKALESATSVGQQLLILSGGYGVALASEPIGIYDRAFKYSDWPSGLLESVLLQYVRASQLENIVAVVSATTGYRAFLDRVRWKEVKLNRVFYLMPGATSGAMVKAPRAQGDALAALLTGTLDRSFISSDGLQMEVQRISTR